MRPSHSVSRRTWFATAALPGLSFEKLFPPICEVVVPRGDAKRTAGVDPADFEDLIGDRSQECPVVGRHQVAERGSTQESFQPDDAGQVEVVGRFVEEQNIGSADEFRASQRCHPPDIVSRVGRGLQPTWVSVIAILVSRS